MNNNCKRSEKFEMRIKYFEGATKLEAYEKGNCIDVYARKDVFIPYMGYAMIPLGFALELPKGKTGRLIPRSSTFKTWGIIQTNHYGYIDDTYIGDNDEWHMPVQCTMAKQEVKTEIEGHKVTLMGTWVKKGDKIGQFTIEDAMTMPIFTEVEHLGNENRGGFGTSSSR